MVFGSAHPLGMILYGRQSKMRLSRYSLIVAKKERILRITSLSEEVETAKDILAAVKPSILFPHCGQSKRRAPKFTREFPKAKFSSRQVAKRKATTYFARIAKRLRA